MEQFGERVIAIVKQRNPGRKVNFIDMGKCNNIKDYLVNAFEKNSASAMSLSSSNLNKEELFLMNGFKTMFSSKLVSLIANWFDNKFMVIYRADALHLVRKFTDPKKESIYIEKTLNEKIIPFYANTHTTASATGFKTTYFYSQAKKIIKKAVNANEKEGPNQDHLFFGFWFNRSNKWTC